MNKNAAGELKKETNYRAKLVIDVDKELLLWQNGYAI